MFEIVDHGHLSKLAVFDRFSHIWRALGLRVLFQSARSLGGPIPHVIGGWYVQFLMVDVPLFDVRSKMFGHGGSLYVLLKYTSAYT